MKPLMKVYCLLFICILLLTSCAAKRPGWIMEVPKDKQYIYAVGMKTAAFSLEEGKRSAVQQAVTELVEHFELQSRVRYQERKTELETKVMDEIQSLSGDVKIRGSLISEWHFEKTNEGKYDVYILLRYPREELERERARQRNEAARKISQIQRALSNGENAEVNGNLTEAMNSYLTAVKLAAIFEDTALHSSAHEMLNQLVTGIQIRVVSGNDQTIDMSRKIDYQLVAKTVLKKGGYEIPLSDLPVKFSFPNDKGIEALSIKSDQDGMAIFRIPRLPTATKDYRVQATIDVDQMFIIPSDLSKSDQKSVRHLADHLRSKSSDFTFHTFVVRKDLKVIVLIDEKNHGVSMRESITGNEISKRLFDAGYQVIADQDIGKTNIERLKIAIQKDELFSLNKTIYGMVDVVVTGTCNTREGTHNSGVVISSHADGFIKAVDLRNGSVVAQKNALDTVGFGETEEQAGINALKKLGTSISEEIVGQLLDNSATNK